jgi:hypothetical protein
MSAVRSPYTRTAWFYRGTRFEPGKDHVFSELDEEKHNKRRQQMASGVRTSTFSLFLFIKKKGNLLTDSSSILAKKTLLSNPQSMLVF